MRTKLTALILTIFLKTCSLSGAGQKVLPLAVLHSSVNDEQFSWICLIISAVQILRCITDWKINSCTLQHFGKKRCIKYDSVTVWQWRYEHPEIEAVKWNPAITNLIIHTCIFPIATFQNVFYKKNGPILSKQGFFFSAVWKQCTVSHTAAAAETHTEVIAHRCYFLFWRARCSLAASMLNHQSAATGVNHFAH